MPLRRTMKEVQTLEPGTYKVRLMDLKATTLENPQFGTGDVIRFVLETTDVLDDEGNPSELDAIANDKLTPLSKLTRWLGSFGVTAAPGESIDMEDAIDREAMAVVIHRPGKDGTGAFARVDDIVPLPKTGGKPQRTVRVKPEASPDFDGFWRDVRAMGKEQKDVLPFLPNKDLRDMADLDATGLVSLLEKVSS